MSEDAKTALAKAMGWDDDSLEQWRVRNAKLNKIREARGCHCKKSIAECLCGLSWWKRVMGDGERERWNEAMRLVAENEKEMSDE